MAISTVSTALATTSVQGRQVDFQGESPELYYKLKLASTITKGGMTRTLIQLIVDPRQDPATVVPKSAVVAQLTLSRKAKQWSSEELSHLRLALVNLPASLWNAADAGAITTAAPTIDHDYDAATIVAEGTI